MPTPFLTGWSKRKEVRYADVFPGANLSDFPKLLFIGGDTGVASECSGGGGVTFTEADGETEVPFGLYPTADLASGNVPARVKFGTLLTGASTDDVMGYLYYDSGQTTVEDKAGTVDNDYAAFLVPGDYSGNVLEDWVTESQYAGSGGLSSSDLVSSPESQGLDYDGSDDFVPVNATLPDIDGAKTVELITKYENDTRRTLFSMVLDDSVSAGNSCSLMISSAFVVPVACVEDWGGAQRVVAFLDPGNANVASETWFSFAYTTGASWVGQKAYINGVDRTFFPSTSANSGTPAVSNVGAFNAAFRAPYHNRPIGTIRVSSVVRDADWFAYQHQDDFNNADTFYLGGEEEDAGGGGFVAYPRPRGAYAGMSVMTGGMS